jgi:hypothetical protein
MATTFDAIFSALDSTGVRYVVVGGVAVKHYPLDFESLWRDSIPIQLPDALPRIAAIDHLILMKRAAGRPQDVGDVDMLEKLKVLIAEPKKP